MYKLMENGVMRLADRLVIPNDTRNRHWKEYQSWLAEGNTPEPQFTREELAERKLAEVAEERKRLTREANEAQGIPLVVKLLRKAIAGTLTLEDEAILDSIEGIQQSVEEAETALDNAEAYIRDPARTPEELEQHVVHRPVIPRERPTVKTDR